MYFISDNIIHDSSHHVRRCWWLCLLVCSWSCLLTSSAVAQVENWSYDTVNTTVGSDLPLTFNPQVVIDRWGVSHYTWATRDPNSAGLQVYYSDDQTNEIGAPFLFTDTGTLYDSLRVDSTSYRSLVDQKGVLHVAFLANVFGQNGLEIGLYYTDSQQEGFQGSSTTLLTKNSGRYNMAVDSGGVAHVLWLEESGGGIDLHYWEGQSRTDHVVTTIPCGGVSCRFSDPEVEVFNDRLEVFIRNDSGAVWQVTLSLNGVVGNVGALPIPSLRLSNHCNWKSRSSTACSTRFLWSLSSTHSNRVRMTLFPHFFMQQMLALVSQSIFMLLLIRI